jgi:hypothetical protein
MGKNLSRQAYKAHEKKFNAPTATTRSHRADALTGHRDLSCIGGNGGDSLSPNKVKIGLTGGPSDGKKNINPKCARDFTSFEGVGGTNTKSRQ